MPENKEEFKPVGEVTIDIDYQIIKHFSEHLYSSPNKAIEELVINGYDAGASWVKVFIKGKYTESVLVWDNGYSMDAAGIGNLWKLASSPKRDSDRVVRTTDGKHRDVIGKFGIGKIASYTLGDVISHLCKSDGHYLLIHVNYRDLLGDQATELELEHASLTGGEKNLGSRNQDSSTKEVEQSERKTNFKTNIFELTEVQAKSYCQSLFNVLPADFEALFSSKHWTLAIIELLKKAITPGRLGWVLSNGMPIRPDFSIQVNNDLLTPKLLKTGTVVKWDFSEEKVQAQLKSKWADALGKGFVEGNISFGEKKGLNPAIPTIKVPFVNLPQLGKVWGELRLYERSLKAYDENDGGRSYGFFINVKGRLVNTEDPQVLLHDPSFATFYSGQWILNIDGLDVELLADRERFQNDTKMSAELSILQKAVYYALDNVVRNRVDPQALQSLATILPVQSNDLFIAPLMSLWMNRGELEEMKVDPQNPEVITKPLGEQNSFSTFNPSEGFLLNSEHPYYVSISSSIQKGKKGEIFWREVQALAIAETLFEGFLHDRGVALNTIKEILSWRDAMYRSLAHRDIHEEEVLCKKLMEASFVQGRTFEKALANILDSMGFVSERKGESGKEDVYIKANCGDDSYIFTFEAKALTKEGASLPNDKVEVSGAASHKTKAGAEHVVIVTRKFGGSSREEEAAVILECREQKGDAVSIMEVEALIALYRKVKSEGLSLIEIKQILTKLEPPKEKLLSIEQLSSPPNFNLFELLNKIWEYQKGLGKGTPVSARHLWMDGYRDQGLELDDFNHYLASLQRMAPKVIQFDGTNISLSQTPQNISKRITDDIAEKE